MTKLRKHRKAPIRTRLFLALVIFSAVILIILWLGQVVFLDDIYKSIKTAEIKNAAERIVDRIDSPDFSDYSENIAYRSDLCVLALKMENSDTGTRILSSHTQQNCAIHNAQKSSLFSLYDAASKNPNGRSMSRFVFDNRTQSFIPIKDVSRVSSDQNEWIIYSIITKNHSGEKIFIILNSIISPVNATTRTLFFLLIILSLILIVLSVVLAFILSRSISRPVEMLNESAKKLAERDYSVRFSEKGFREVAELGSTLNYASCELAKVDDLCRELIANISHDLRTPLTMITGYSEVMRDLPGENTPENIQIIIDEANRLTTLVNDVLDISRFRSGVQKFECAEFCITDSVNAAVSRYAKLCERDGYVITFEHDEDVYVNSDEVRILQVLYNLINNAITYTGEDRSVRIVQTIKDGRVRISVTDSGDGIPAEKLEYIWERYYKVDAVHKRAAVGSGLGLSIVRSIIEMAQGSCGVSSTVGEGSTFWFELDIAKHDLNQCL